MNGGLEFPPWLKLRLRPGDDAARRAFAGVATVCEDAACPNIGECWRHGHAAMMILGHGCTRRCGFCNVSGRDPEPPDKEEPERVAEAISRTTLREVVITSVTRDDLPDGGATHWARVLRAVHDARPDISVEALVPDFQGDAEAIATVLAADPDIFGHNIETVPRLYPAARPGADYARSLSVLRAASAAGVTVKSAMMLGLGERDDEVRATLEDLRSCGVASVVIGQYLRPSPWHLEVARFVRPETFAELGAFALSLGFAGVVSEPFARSSYRKFE